MIKREPYERQFIKLMAKGMRIIIEEREQELEMKEKECKNISKNKNDS
ncbi:hypothetical protein J2T13_003620 [Paenibacillus sp. DS2015]